jgi:hypothetical protein
MKPQSKTLQLKLNLLAIKPEEAQVKAKEIVAQVAEDRATN